MVEIDFSFLKTNPGNIIIRNSGGPDCAIIYYLAAKYVKENNLDIDFIHLTVNTTQKYWYIHYAKNVINFVKKEIGIEPINHVTSKNNVVTEVQAKNGTIIEGYAEAQWELSKQIMDSYDIKYEFTGATNMLPKRFLNDKLLEGTVNPNLVYADYSRRSIEDGNEEQSLFMNVEGRTIFHPLINKDKRTVKELYDQYNLTDTLFSLTRSCERTADHPKYKGREHCDWCIFCFERKFAFGKL